MKVLMSLTAFALLPIVLTTSAWSTAAVASDLMVSERAPEPIVPVKRIDISPE